MGQGFKFPGHSQPVRRGTGLCFYPLPSAELEWQQQRSEASLLGLEQWACQPRAPVCQASSSEVQELCQER